MSLTASLVGTSNFAGLTATDGVTGNTAPIIQLLKGVTFTGSLLEYLNPYTIGVANPTNLAATPSTSGGSFSAGTYYWVVTALNGTGQTMASNEVSAVLTGSTSSVALAWNAMPGATSYQVWRGTSSAGENHYQTSTSPTFTDTGATGTSGTLPVSNTTGTTYTPSLTQTPLQVVFLQNLSQTNNLTVAWTPTGGSSNTVAVLMPSSGILLFESVSGGGITAFTLTASTQGTQVAGAWIS